MKISYAAICIVFVLLLSEAELSMGAMTCNPLELSPCASAITGANAPSAICCSKLKEQRICLCQYMKDPNLRKFVNSPNARKVATVCGSPFPRC
ncbi:AAI domain-containing protein [Citrus sinensis]|uniref:AAI domain-containing protein n=4 Tax=Citrus TaxID=2706 RepID=A0ACB8NAA9_CITSI|nr:non-specific lipid-transfer protein 2 [Citrus x clementina]XP_006468752.1 non-specific lipid-transfer protein 2 [Citrus sinensis]GAY47607.1 hypothetical protein CUMW_105660 [Citrus unshiu]KAH9746695.1 AAI domain-containing protein [Citrus sinensis]KAH9795046.1 AAI domain-containing protein [Citrus sinensis]KDO76904.1 hypothetical protein CISIN_1g035485mg [Citrus sinensis]